MTIERHSKAQSVRLSGSDWIKIASIGFAQAASFAAFVYKLDMRLTSLEQEVKQTAIGTIADSQKRIERLEARIFEERR